MTIKMKTGQTYTKPPSGVAGNARAQLGQASGNGRAPTSQKGRAVVSGNGRINAAPKTSARTAPIAAPVVAKTVESASSDEPSTPDHAEHDVALLGNGGGYCANCHVELSSAEVDALRATIDPSSEEIAGGETDPPPDHVA